MLTFTWHNGKARQKCSFKSSLNCALIQKLGNLTQTQYQFSLWRKKKGYQIVSQNDKCGTI